METRNSYSSKTIHSVPHPQKCSIESAGCVNCDTSNGIMSRRTESWNDLV
jgi:hypothetical protein